MTFIRSSATASGQQSADQCARLEKMLRAVAASPAFDTATRAEARNILQSQFAKS
jgi:hypothetical protein